jgi:hypothetical protein
MAHVAVEYAGGICKMCICAGIIYAVIDMIGQFINSSTIAVIMTMWLNIFPFKDFYSVRQ